MQCFSDHRQFLEPVATGRRVVDSLPWLVVVRSRLEFCDLEIERLNAVTSTSIAFGLSFPCLLWFLPIPPQSVFIFSTPVLKATTGVLLEKRKSAWITKVPGTFRRTPSL